MPQYTLQPNQVFNLALTGRYLNVLEVTGDVLAQSSDGIKPFKFKGGRTLDVGNFESLELKNVGNTAATYDVEINNIKIEANSGGEVSIKGAVSVSDMPPVSVTANATVQNGSMQLNEPNVIGTVIDVTVAAGASAEIVPARAAKGRRIQLNNVSESKTVCRVGDASVAANRGTPLIGSKDIPSGWIVATRAAVHVFNASTEPAKISVTELYSND